MTHYEADEQLRQLAERHAIRQEMDQHPVEREEWRSARAPRAAASKGGNKDLARGREHYWRVIA